MARPKSPVVKLKTAHQVVFSAAEDRMAFFGGRNVTVLSVPSFKPLFSTHALSHPLDVDFSPDESRLVVKSTSGRTAILDSKTGRTLRDFRNQKESAGSGPLFSNCGHYVVSVSWNGLLTVRHSATAELVFSKHYSGGMLNDLSAPRDRRFFVYSFGGYPTSDSQPPPPEIVVLHPWPIRDAIAQELPQRWPFINRLQVSPSGRLLAVIYGAPPVTMEIYDIVQSRVIAKKTVGFGGTGCSIGWSPDESLIGINGNHTCTILEMQKLKIRHEFPVGYLCHVGFSPSMRFLALGSWESSFILPFDYVGTFAQSMAGKASS